MNHAHAASMTPTASATAEDANAASDTVLCVCTYRRPRGLRALLDSLEKLQSAGGMQIVVIDNHADGEGAAVCAALPALYPYNVYASIQATPGISHARNAAVAKALQLQPRFVVFLDDDEQPESQWLEELKRIQLATGADVVGGPTRSVFPPGTDDSIRSNPYYGAEIAVTDGAACKLEAAGNFLIRAELLRQMDGSWFHPAFTRSGGEDLAFFTQLGQRGATMHWASNAIVHEDVPANRLTEQWMQERVINIANSRVRVMQMLEPGIVPAMVRGLKTLALFTVATLTSLVGLVHPASRHKAKLLRWKFRGKCTAHMRIVTTRGEGH